MKNLEVLGSYLLIRLLNCSSVVPFQMGFEDVEEFFLFLGGDCVASFLLASF